MSRVNDGPYGAKHVLAPSVVEESEVTEVAMGQRILRTEAKPSIQARDGVDALGFKRAWYERMVVIISVILQVAQL